MKDKLERAREKAAGALDWLDVRADHTERILDAFLAALREERLVIEEDWKPIESAPKDGTRILVSDGVTVQAARWRRSTPEYIADCWTGDDDWEGCRPTHWKPLSAPPSQAGQ